MSDAQRSRRNAAECLSAADRCELPYRRPAVAIAEAWLSLARHQEAMNELLAIWSKARAPTSASDTLTIAPWKPTSSSAPGDSSEPLSIMDRDTVEVCRLVLGMRKTCIWPRD
jgi:hypothetical protein